MEIPKILAPFLKILSNIYLYLRIGHLFSMYVLCRKNNIINLSQNQQKSHLIVKTTFIIQKIFKNYHLLLS